MCAISVVGQGPFSSVFAEAAINDLELWQKLEKISEERWRSCLCCTWEIRAPPLVFDSSFGNLGIVLGQSGIPRKSYYWLLTLTPPEDDKVSNYSQILSKENTMRNNILTSSWSREEKVSKITKIYSEKWNLSRIFTFRMFKKFIVLVLLVFSLIFYY